MEFMIFLDLVHVLHKYS